MVVMVGGCAVVLAGHCCCYRRHTGDGHNDRHGRMGHYCISWVGSGRRLHVCR